jgi:hypothetical protein
VAHDSRAIALVLLCFQGMLGAFDTLYFHEFKAKLPSLSAAAPELRLHAFRDFIYAVFFCSLPLFELHGAYALLLLLLVCLEIATTLSDFVIERAVRKPLGGTYSGELVTHGIMAIIYGGFLAYLVPLLWEWSKRPSQLLYNPSSRTLVVLMEILGAGVLISGLRDWVSARALRAATSK